MDYTQCCLGCTGARSQVRQPCVYTVNWLWSNHQGFLSVLQAVESPCCELWREYYHSRSLFLLGSLWNLTGFILIWIDVSCSLSFFRTNSCLEVGHDIHEAPENWQLLAWLRHDTSEHLSSISLEDLECCCENSGWVETSHCCQFLLSMSVRSYLWAMKQKWKLSKLLSTMHWLYCWIRKINYSEMDELRRQTSTVICIAELLPDHRWVHRTAEMPGTPVLWQLMSM